MLFRHSDSIDNGPKDAAVLVGQSPFKRAYLKLDHLRGCNAFCLVNGDLVIQPFGHSASVTDLSVMDSPADLQGFAVDKEYEVVRPEEPPITRDRTKRNGDVLNAFRQCVAGVNGIQPNTEEAEIAGIGRNEGLVLEFVEYDLNVLGENGANKRDDH